MHEDWVEKELQRSLPGKTNDPTPAFAAVMQAAEKRHAAGGNRLRLAAAAAVVATVAIMVVGRWSATPEAIDDEFLIAASMLGSTSWTAPSDALLPQYRIDIYRDMPTFSGQPN